MENETGTLRVKTGLAEMLKGGVIMDVTTADQAKIAEEAGAVAVMALERVPADIRAEGGVARMADPTKVAEIMETVSIPVMAKCRIGHFVEAQILQALGVDYIDESEVLTPAEDELAAAAKELGAPFDLVRQVAATGKLPVVNFSAGGIATPADAALMMQLGADGNFVGSGIFKSEDPAARARAIVEATTYYNDPEILAKVSRSLGEPMRGLDVATMSEGELLQTRGW